MSDPYVVDLSRVRAELARIDAKDELSKTARDHLFGGVRRCLVTVTEAPDLETRREWLKQRLMTLLSWEDAPMEAFVARARTARRRQG